MRVAFTDLVGALPRLASDVEHLDEGSLNGDDYLAQHRLDVAIAADARDRVRRTAGFPGDRRPKELSLQSAMLYVEALRAFTDAASTSGDLRHQLILSGKRIRVLADRIFDRGSRIVEVRAHDAATPDIEVHLPAEVPDWTHEGYAAGPPVGSATTNRATVDERDSHRAVQGRSTWVSVARRPVSDVQEVVRGLQGLSRSNDVHAAVRAADRAEAAVATTRRTADPQGGREPFATMRLGMLVEAEAARTFALASMAPAGVAPDVRRRAADLAAVGEAVWRAGWRALGAVPALAPTDSGLHATGLGPAVSTRTTSTSSSPTTTAVAP